MKEKMTCSVCGEKKAEGVYSSRIAPVSLAYCRSCMEKGADSYGVVVTRIAQLRDPSSRSERLQHVIEETLEITGYTKEQFEEDVKKAIQRKNERVVRDKIKGGLFGVAIGDALGGTTEFMTEREIRETFGTVDEIIGGGVWNLEPGEVTDDTQMTMAVAQGIITNPQNPIQAIGTNFLEWYNTKPKDVGIIISSVLSQYQEDWFETAEKVHYQLDQMSAGNGSLMRCLPVSLGYASLEETIQYTTEQSKMTHFDDQASEACLIYNKIAYRLLNNEPLKESIEKEVKGTIYEKSLSIKPDVPADGYVIHTLLWVIYYFYHLEDFKEIAIQATNKGGDSDTIAAIACGLKGVEVGYHSLPDQYKNKILLKDDLATLSNKLFEIRKSHKE